MSGEMSAVCLSQSKGARKKPQPEGIFAVIVTGGTVRIEVTAGV